MEKTLIDSGGEAVVRTVAPGFEPGDTKRSPRFVSALERAKERTARKPSLSPAQAGSHNRGTLANPRLKAGGYGSHAGFADGGRP
jgi:hypothetical protein